MTDKIKVITTGPFMLRDPYSGVDIEPSTETEVVETHFIKDRIEIGQLRIVAAAAKAPAKAATK